MFMGTAKKGETESELSDIIVDSWVVISLVVVVATAVDDGRAAKVEVAPGGGYGHQSKEEV